MIIDNNEQNINEERDITSSIKDLEIGERIKKVTTHDLFELKKGDQIYVAKLFKSEFRHNYELQLNILKHLKHPNIIELVYYQSSDSQNVCLWNCDMLILKWAERGSLNEYIPMNGKLPQNISRCIFKQMISGLKYASSLQPNGVVHPNLLPSSILLNKERQVKICGWSKVSEKQQKKQLIKQMLFSCCQILILMLSNFMPFYKKHSTSDPLYKFLKPNLIEKFWSNFEKRIATKYKQFVFSKEAKQLIQKVFLGEWTTFQQIEQSQWMKLTIPSKQEYNSYLSELQNQAHQRRQDNFKKQLQRQQKKRQIIMQYQESTLRGSSNRSSDEYDFFIQDFYQNFYLKQDVPTSQCSELIRLYDNRPNFIIASLKQHLRNLDSTQLNLLLGGFFKLESYSAEMHQNEAYLNLKFQQINEDEMEQETSETIQIKVKAFIRFFKNKKNHLFAQVKIFESNLNEFYANLVMNFIEDKIRGFQVQK